MTPVCRRDVVGDDPDRSPSWRAFACACCDHVLGLGREADDERRAAGCCGARWWRGCRGSRSSARAGSAPPFFLIFCVAGIGDAPIGDRGGEDGDIGRQRRFDGRRASRAALSTWTVVTPAGSGRATGPGDQGDAGAGRRGGARDGVALLAGGAVGDVAHRIDRLVRRAGGDERRACRRAARDGASSRSTAATISSGSAMRPGRTRLGHRAVVRADDVHAVGLQRSRGCAASPGAATCARSSPARSGSAASVASSAVEARSSAWPSAILAMRSAVAGATTIEVGVAREADMADIGLVVAVEEIGMRCARRRAPRPRAA